MRSPARYAALFVLLLAPAARAAETETQYLSGLGKDDPVQWEFMCDKGQNANKWSTIGVPSNWQLQGFGIYEYGQPTPRGRLAANPWNLQADLHHACHLAGQNHLHQL